MTDYLTLRKRVEQLEQTFKLLAEANRDTREEVGQAVGVAYDAAAWGVADMLQSLDGQPDGLAASPGVHLRVVK